VTVTNGSGTGRYAPEPEFRDLYDPHLEAHLDWLDGERSGHRCDARAGHSATEVLMAVSESARTTGVVRAPLRTRANPLTAVIESGELPVEKPGPYGSPTEASVARRRRCRTPSRRLFGTVSLLSLVGNPPRAVTL
jgi:hypothetical protein